MLYYFMHCIVVNKEINLTWLAAAFLSAWSFDWEILRPRHFNHLSSPFWRSLKLQHLDHVYTPQYTEFLPCDWLINCSFVTISWDDLKLSSKSRPCSAPFQTPLTVLTCTWQPGRWSPPLQPTAERQRKIPVFIWKWSKTPEKCHFEVFTCGSWSLHR